MNDAELAQLVKSSLFSVAPDLEGENVRPDEPFREQFEIDSMDLINFMVALHEQTGIDIPESDYARLETLSGAIAYLKSKGFGQ